MFHPHPLHFGVVTVLIVCRVVGGTFCVHLCNLINKSDSEEVILVTVSCDGIRTVFLC